MNSLTAKLCWSIVEKPSLSRLHREGRFDEAERDRLIAIAEGDFRRANPDGMARAIDFCHALELAAEKILNEPNQKTVCVSASLR